MENNTKKENIRKEVTAYDIELKKLERLEKKEKEISEFKLKNKYKLIGLVLSFLTICSLMDYGFFKTIGIWIVMVVGYCVGAWFDRDPKFIKFIMDILRNY